MDVVDFLKTIKGVGWRRKEEEREMGRRREE